jgi:hypothetical protein
MCIKQKPCSRTYSVSSNSSNCVTWGLLIQAISCRPVATGDTNSGVVSDRYSSDVDGGR